MSGLSPCFRYVPVGLEFLGPRMLPLWPFSYLRLRVCITAPGSVRVFELESLLILSFHTNELQIAASQEETTGGLRKSGVEQSLR